MAENNKKKTVYLPLLDGDNAPTEVFVGLNGKAYRVGRGVEVEVPEGVYNILMRSKYATDHALREKQRLGIKKAKESD